MATSTKRGQRPHKTPEAPVFKGVHTVKGITSSIDDLRLNGQKFTAVVGEAIIEVELNRKIVGASELILTILDPSPTRLLRSQLLSEAHEIVIDGLRWRLVKVANEGRNEPLVLTYEPLIVYVLKKLHGPHKAFRDNVTRAEFAKARWLEGANPSLASKQFAESHGNKEVEKQPAKRIVLPPVPDTRFISPELHVTQPIKSTGKEATKEAAEERRKGIGLNTNLKINGAPATAAQVEILERMLQEATREKSATVVMEALVLACIDESGVGTLTDNLLEIEPPSVSGFHGDVANPEEAARGFLQGYSSGPGAIAIAKQHPGYTAAQIATSTQRNLAFIEGGLDAGAQPYERFNAEGKAIVADFGGGAEVGTVSTERYAFDQKKKESNWHCMVALATAVRWRCFESAAWVYFLDEPTLMRSPIRMIVTDTAPGIVDTSFDYDVGKDVTTMTVEADGHAWGAPPGSCAQVSRHGPADGLYLVEDISSKPSSTDKLVTVTLKKPTEPLPEPAPKKTKGTASFGGGASNESAPADAPVAIQKMIDEVDATDGKFTYKWGGGHESVAALKQRLSAYDCSGYVSHILWAGGLLGTPESSVPLESFGEAGEGKFCTIYANAEHAFGKLLTAAGWRYFESGGEANATGWVPDGQQDPLGRYTARHPKGM